MRKKFVLLIFLAPLFVPGCSQTKTGPEPEEESTGLPQETMIPLDGLLFESGVFAMHKASEVTKWEENRGAEVAIIAVMPSRTSWEEMQNTWFMDDQRIPKGFKGTLNVAVPLWPEDGSLEAAVNGSYNVEWENFGRSLASVYPDAYIRLSAEMNINDHYHKATPENAEDWKAAFRLAVTNLRKASSSFRFIFNPNEGPGQTGTRDATFFYPGDEYIDLIGIDVYDWWPGYTTEANIAFHRDQPYGWNWWLNYAKQRNKKFCVPEWGIATANPNSGGDNAMYINFVYSWLKENKEWIEMECYFHESDDYIRSDLFTGYNPKATAAYKQWMPLLKKSTK